MKNAGGFTLMEAMVSFVVIGVVGAVTVPNVPGWARSHHLKGAASALYTDIQTARIRTIKDKVRHSLRMEGANGRWILYHVGPNNTNENGGGDDVIIRTRMMSEIGGTITCGLGHATRSVTGVSVSGPNFNTFGVNSRVTFNAMGQCNAGFFYLANGDGAAMAVGTLSSGSVRTRRWYGSTWK